MQEDFIQNRLHPGISMHFEACGVRVRLFKCVSPNYANTECVETIHRAGYYNRAGLRDM